MTEKQIAKIEEMKASLPYFQEFTENVTKQRQEEMNNIKRWFKLYERGSISFNEMTEKVSGCVKKERELYQEESLYQSSYLTKKYILDVLEEFDVV